MELVLKKPIQHGDEEIKVLYFDEPNAAIIRDLGFPFSFSDDEVSVKAKVCFRYLNRLTKQPNSVIEKMSPEDFKEACLVVVGFFKESVELN